MAHQKYRGIPIPVKYLDIAKNLDSVNNLIDELKDLQGTWTSLSLLGELTQVGSEISNTRHDFQDLACNLTRELIELSMRKAINDLGNKAQCSIDILIRNLFERTADIGFLATDVPLQTLCLNAIQAEPSNAEVASIIDRLARYASSYSVYRNAVILDASGCVILDLNQRYPKGFSTEWVKTGVANSGTYFEWFGRFHPELDAQDDLVYAWKIIENNCIVGYVCLLFNLAEEGLSLFSKILGHTEETLDKGSLVCGVMDEHFKVVMSSDPHHIQYGQVLNLSADKPWSLIHCGPTVYLGCLRKTRGYQGYGGPGWMGFSLVPLVHAFSDPEHDLESDNEISETIQKSENNSPKLSLAQAEYVIDSKLLGLESKAHAIQNQLNRSVWNGNITQKTKKQSLGDTFTKTLLWEISRAGERTRMLFHDSLQNLSKTTIESTQDQQKAAAMLAIDLMDRNLYERANDCRWWALTPTLHDALSTPNDSDCLSIADQTLETINGLYTVYTDIFLLDAKGLVLAASQSKQWKGECLSDEDWFRRALSLRKPEHYVVSEFASSKLYGEKHTYIYCAAVYDNPNKPSRVLGVVALVFDSEPQFEAILNDSKNSTHKDAFGLILNRDGLVISSTTNRYTEGEKLALEINLEHVSRGLSATQLLSIDDVLYAVGLSQSSQYREYKSKQDCYQNDVLALFATPVGPAEIKTNTIPVVDFTEFRHADSSSGSMEVATFRVGQRWLGLSSDDVIEAFLPKNLARMPNAKSYIAGTVLHKGRAVTVIDLAMLTEKNPEPFNIERKQIILMRLKDNEVQLGLAIDELGEIPNIPIDQIEFGDNILGQASILGGLVNTRSGFIGLLDYDRLLKHIDGISESASLQHG